MSQVGTNYTKLQLRTYISLCIYVRKQIYLMCQLGPFPHTYRKVAIYYAISSYSVKARVLHTLYMRTKNQSLYRLAMKLHTYYCYTCI